MIQIFFFHKLLQGMSASVSLNNIGLSAVADKDAISGFISKVAVFKETCSSVCNTVSDHLLCEVHWAMILIEPEGRQ